MKELRKELFEKIASSDKLSSFIQSSAVDGMWYWDLTDSSRYWISDSLWITLGYDPKEARENNIILESLTFPEDVQKASKASGEVVSDPSKRFKVTIRYWHKNGNIVYLDTRGTAVFDENGIPYRFFGIAHNITPQIETERRLKKERDRFKSIISSSDLGTWEWNVQTGETRFNDKWAEIIGYSLQELQPINIDTWIGNANSDDLEKSNNKLQNHFEGKSDFYVAEARMKHKAGHWVWVMDKGKVISWTEDGKPEWMVGTHQDITTKKRMERSLAKAYRNTQTLINSAPVSIAMFDSDMNYIAASPTWLKENGLENKAFIGINHYNVSSKISDSWKEVHKEALSGKTIQQDAELVNDINGQQRWIKWDVRPWYKESEIGGIIIYSDDITNLKLQKLELEKANELLLKTNEIAEIGHWKVDLVKMEVDWSDATKKIHEVSKDYKGKVEDGINFYKEGESRDKVAKIFNKAIAEGIPFDEELIIITAKGKERWVRTIGLPEMKDGQCIYIHGLFINIDKQKRYNDSVLNIAENYRSLLQSLPDKIYKTNAEGQMLASYGKGDFKEVITNSGFDDIEKEIKPTSLAKKLSDEYLLSVSEEKYFEHYDKEESSWFEVRIIPDIKSKSNLILIRDISKRKEAESELTEMGVLLERTNKIAGVGSWEVDLVDNSLTCNSTVKEILEIPKEFQLYQTNVPSFFTSEDYIAFRSSIRESIDNQATFDEEFQNLTFEGNRIWTRIVGYPEFEGSKCVRFYGVLLNIDTQKRTSEKMILKETQFRTAFESTELGMVIASVKGFIQDCNERFSDLMGYKKNDIIGSHFSRYTIKEEVAAEVEMLIEIEQGTRDSYTIEKKNVRKNGEEIWILLVISAIRDQNGNALHLIGQIFDIDEQKKTREQLKYSERRFKSVYNSTFQFIGFLKPDSVIVSLNNTALDFLGKKMEDVQGLKFAYGFWWNHTVEESDKLKDSLERAAQGEFIRYETKVFNKDLNSFTIDFSITPVWNDDGNIDILIVEGRQINELVAYRQQIEETALHLKSILDASTSIAIIEADPSGKILTFNKGAENLLGYSEEEALGSLRVADLHNKDVWNRWVSDIEGSDNINADKYSYQKVFEVINKKPDKTFEIEYQRKDKSVFPGLVSRTTIKDTSGSPKGVLVVVSDITQLKRSENDLKNLLNITTEQNKRLFNFAHIVSHNLRSHAGNLTMLLDLMIAENPNDKELEYIPYLKKAASGLMETITHLNKIAVMNANELTDLEEVDLSECVIKNINNLKAQILESNIELEVDVPKGMVVRAVPAYLESIIINLLTNAIKYRSEKRVPLIAVNATIKDDYIIINIEDNGIGIDLEKYGTKIFGLYSTFHDGKKVRDSRGIGLFITKNQVEAMGGKIEVSSIPDIGTRFSVRLLK
jgi:PAS domain S-box-containing protein